MFGERLLRPALVGISKKNVSKNEEKKEKKIENNLVEVEKNTHIEFNRRINNNEQSNWN